MGIEMLVGASERRGKKMISPSVYAQHIQSETEMVYIEEQIASRFPPSFLLLLHISMSRRRKAHIPEQNT